MANIYQQHENLISIELTTDNTTEIIDNEKLNKHKNKKIRDNNSVDKNNSLVNNNNSISKNLIVVNTQHNIFNSPSQKLIKTNVTSFSNDQKIDNTQVKDCKSVYTSDIPVDVSSDSPLPKSPESILHVSYYGCQESISKSFRTLTEIKNTDIIPSNSTSHRIQSTESPLENFSNMENANNLNHCENLIEANLLTEDDLLCEKFYNDMRDFELDNRPEINIDYLLNDINVDEIVEALKESNNNDLSNGELSEHNTCTTSLDEYKNEKYKKTCSKVTDPSYCKNKLEKSHKVMVEGVHGLDSKKKKSYSHFHIKTKTKLKSSTDKSKKLQSVIQTVKNNDVNIKLIIDKNKHDNYNNTKFKQQENKNHVPKLSNTQKRIEKSKSQNEIKNERNIAEKNDIIKNSNVDCPLGQDFKNKILEPDISRRLTKKSISDQGDRILTNSLLRKEVYNVGKYNRLTNTYSENFRQKDIEIASYQNTKEILYKADKTATTKYGSIVNSKLALKNYVIPKKKNVSPDSDINNKITKEVTLTGFKTISPFIDKINVKITNSKSNDISSTKRKIHGEHDKYHSKKTCERLLQNINIKSECTSQISANHNCQQNIGMSKMSQYCEFSLIKNEINDFISQDKRKENIDRNNLLEPIQNKIQSIEYGSKLHNSSIVDNSLFENSEKFHSSKQKLHSVLCIDNVNLDNSIALNNKTVKVEKVKKRSKKEKPFFTDYENTETQKTDTKAQKLSNICKVNKNLNKYDQTNPGLRNDQNVRYKINLSDQNHEKDGSSVFQLQNGNHFFSSKCSKDIKNEQRSLITEDINKLNSQDKPSLNVEKTRLQMCVQNNIPISKCETKSLNETSETYSSKQNRHQIISTNIGNRFNTEKKHNQSSSHSIFVSKGVFQMTRRLNKDTNDLSHNKIIKVNKAMLKNKERIKINKKVQKYLVNEELKNQNNHLQINENINLKIEISDNNKVTPYGSKHKSDRCLIINSESKHQEKTNKTEKINDNDESICMSVDAHENISIQKVSNKQFNQEDQAKKNLNEQFKEISQVNSGEINVNKNNKIVQNEEQSKKISQNVANFDIKKVSNEIQDIKHLNEEQFKEPFENVKDLVNKKVTDEIRLNEQGVKILSKERFEEISQNNTNIGDKKISDEVNLNKQNNKCQTKEQFEEAPQKIQYFEDKLNICKKQSNQKGNKMETPEKYKELSDIRNFDDKKNSGEINVNELNIKILTEQQLQETSVTDDVHLKKQSKKNQSEEEHEGTSQIVPNLEDKNVCCIVNRNKQSKKIQTQEQCKEISKNVKNFDDKQSIDELNFSKTKIKKHLLNIGKINQLIYSENCKSDTENITVAVENENNTDQIEGTKCNAHKENNKNLLSNCCLENTTKVEISGSNKMENTHDLNKKKYKSGSNISSLKFTATDLQQKDCLPINFLDENFIINKTILHRGFNSTMIKAITKYEKKQVVIKIIHKKFFHYFEKYTDILNILRDADETGVFHIMNFEKIILSNSNPCIIMEYYPHNLAQALYTAGSGFEINQVQLLSRQMLSALMLFRIQKICHRDIKPKHILLNADNSMLKVTGFERSTMANSHKISFRLASLNYLAPEVLIGTESGYPADIWAAACTMFEMATNQKLFKGSSASEVIANMIMLKGDFNMDSVKRGRFSHQYFKLDAREVMLLENHKIPNGADVKTVQNKVFESRAIFKQEDKIYISFCNLLDGMLTIDDIKRQTVEVAYLHPFIYK